MYIVNKCYFGPKKMPIKILIAVIMVKKNPDAILIRYIKRAINIIRLDGEAGIILPH